MKKRLLLWDIDDVLNDLERLCIETTAQRLKPGLKFENVKNNPPLPELECSLDQYREILDECRDKYLYEQLPRREVLEFFQKNGDSFRSMTLSSAPMALAPRSAEWVLRHFGSWIQGTVFVPSPRKTFTIGSPLFSSKAEAVTALGGILIDDMPINVEAVRKAGGEALYFPAPWNENKDLSLREFFDILTERVLEQDRNVFI